MLQNVDYGRGSRRPRRLLRRDAILRSFCRFNVDVESNHCLQTSFAVVDTIGQRLFEHHAGIVVLMSQVDLIE